MRLLLDTHVLLWSAFEPERLKGDVVSAMEEPGVDVVASVVSIWEIAIKVRLGRLDVDVPYFVGSLGPGNRISLLGIEPSHLVALGRLAVVGKHGDPFDHMLIAQAIAEDITLVSADGWMRAYPVTLMRA